MMSSDNAEVKRTSELLQEIYHKELAKSMELPVDDENGKVVLFFQGGNFYPVWLKESTTIEQHIELNPTTTAVANIDAVVIWSSDPDKPVGYSLFKEGTMYQ